MHMGQRSSEKEGHSMLLCSWNASLTCSLLWFTPWWEVNPLQPRDTTSITSFRPCLYNLLWLHFSCLVTELSVSYWERGKLLESRHLMVSSLHPQLISCGGIFHSTSTHQLGRIKNLSGAAVGGSAKLDVRCDWIQLEDYTEDYMFQAYLEA